MKQEQEQQSTKMYTTNNIPESVYTAVIILVLLFIILTIWMNHSNLDAAMGTLMWWLKAFFYTGIALGIAFIGYRGYEHYHSGRMLHNERKAATLKLERMEIQVETERQKLEVTKQLPALLRYAMEQGHNVEISPKLDVKVTNYLSNIHTLGGAGDRALLAEAADYIPEAFKFSEILQNWQPSSSGILLAKGREMITVPPGEPLCHTTFTSNTDGGKTNNERMLLIQLAFLQQCIYLCDRNYQPFREDRKLKTWYDYTLIEQQLAMPPVVDTKTAVKLLMYLYGIVEDRRTERRKVQNANCIVPFKDIYSVWDELPAFASEDKRVMEILGRLLRESRQYGVFVIAAAQDLLNQTLDNKNGGIRENLLTNFYGGGDMTTARLVLNLARGDTIDETGLGQAGITYLRAKGARIERVKCRTPLSDNEATLMLLGDMPARNATTFPSMPIVESEYPVAPIATTVAQVTKPLLTPDQRAVVDAIAQLNDQGQQASSRNVAELADMGKDKAIRIMNELSEMGVLLSDRQTAEAL